jgi:hypothetical protein
MPVRSSMQLHEGFGLRKSPGMGHLAPRWAVSLDQCLSVNPGAGGALYAGHGLSGYVAAT